MEGVENYKAYIEQNHLEERLVNSKNKGKVSSLPSSGL